MNSQGEANKRELGAGAAYKRLNRLYSVSSGINEVILRITDERLLYEEVCRIAVEKGLLLMAWVGLVEADKSHLTAVASWGKETGYLDEIRVSLIDDCPTGKGPGGEAFRTGKAACCNDIEADSEFFASREKALQRGYLSCAAFPIKVSNRPVGIFVVYSEQRDYFDEVELNLLTALVDNLSFIVEARNEEKHRKRAEIALKASEQQFASAFEYASIGIALVSKRGDFIRTNHSLCQMLGFTEKELLSKSFQEITHPDDLDADMAYVGQLLAGVRQTYQMEKRYFHCDGHIVWILLSVSLVRDESGEPLHFISQIQDISDRKRAEAETLQLAARLTITLESITDPFLTLDSDWRFTYVNREAERLLRHSRANLVGDVIWLKFPQLLNTRFYTEAKRSQAENQTIYFEARHPHLNRWLEVRVYPSPQGLGVHLRDISQQRQAREALLLSEERFRLLAKATNDAVWEWDAVTNRLWHNEGFEQMFGFKREEMEPTLAGWISRIHPRDRERVVKNFHSTLNGGGTAFVDEYQFVRKDGSYAHVLDRGHVIRNTAGKVIRVIGGMTDLTERIRAKEQIAEQAALIDETHDAILVRDLQHRIIFWNKGAERLYGWSATEAIGRQFNEIFHADQDKIRQAEESVLRHGEWNGQIQKTSKNGAILTLDCRWTLLHDAMGRPKSILTIDTDITERKKLEQQFLRAQRMESIGTLAGGIAHDLNNVLAPIMMSIDILKMGEQNRMRLEILGAIESSAKRGADMVQQVLSFARGVEGQRLSVRIDRLLQDIERIVNDTFLKNISVHLNMVADLWTMIGDATQLHQVLINLCVNARDAMPKGGTLTITADNQRLDDHYAANNIEAKPGSYVVVRVEDTGSGMPPVVLEKIFDPFFTTKELGKGTGLGLSTSMAIVRSHGGFMQVHSELNKGTRFEVYLPANTEAFEEVITAQAPDACRRGKGELILVVDDEESVRQITGRSLEAFGYRVLLASDGAEAVAIYADHRDDIAAVLTDMMMPVLDGPATIQVLLKMNPNLRVIAASGLNTHVQVARALDAGIKHFIPKPYTGETLLRILHEILHP